MTDKTISLTEKLPDGSVLHRDPLMPYTGTVRTPRGRFIRTEHLIVRSKNYGDTEVEAVEIFTAMCEAMNRDPVCEGMVRVRNVLFGLTPAPGTDTALANLLMDVFAFYLRHAKWKAHTQKLMDAAQQRREEYFEAIDRERKQRIQRMLDARRAKKAKQATEQTEG